MQMPDKPQIRHALTDSISDQNLQETDQNVVDGEALMHRVRWVKGDTHRQY